jgi:type IV secretion system protein VirB4
LKVLIKPVQTPKVKQRPRFTWYQLSGAPFLILSDADRDLLLRDFTALLNTVKQGVLLARRRLDKFVYRNYAFDVTYYDFYLGAKKVVEVPFFSARSTSLDRSGVKGSAGVKTLVLEGGSFARVLHAYSYPESLPEAFLYSLFPLADEIALIFRSVPKHVAIRMVEGARKRKASAEEVEQQYAVSMLEELAQSILAGSEMFEVHLTFTLIDKDIASLNNREKQVKIQLKSFGIDAEAPPAELQKVLYNFSTCSWLFCAEKTYADSDSLKAMYMLVDEELHDPNGIFLGVSGTGSPVVMDLWSRDNLNFVICGVTGSGKSMTAKVFLKRLAEKATEEGVEVPIIGVDPESEYTRVAHAFNAVPFEVVEIPGKGLDKPLGLDPIKLIQLKALSVGEVADILSDLYIIPVKYQGLLRKALFVLGDQVKDFQEFVIALDAEAEKRRIPEAKALMKYLTGATAPPDADVFRGEPPELSGSLIFGLKNVRSRRLKIMIATFIAAFAYSRLLTRAQKSVFFADEAWLLMELKSTAELIESLARRGRKHGVAFMFISQSAKDLAQNEHGRILLEQSATILTFRHEPEARDTLRDVLKLTDSEVEYLVQAPIGSGILKAGRKRLTVQVLPTEEELEMFSTTVR